MGSKKNKDAFSRIEAHPIQCNEFLLNGVHYTKGGEHRLMTETGSFPREALTEEGQELLDRLHAENLEAFS